MSTALTLVDDLDHVDYLLPSWQRSLRAERLSPRTIDNYLRSARKFASFLADHEMPTAVGSIGCEHIQEFLIDVGERWKDQTVATHFRNLQQLFRWLVQEGEMRLADGPDATTQD